MKLRHYNVATGETIGFMLDDRDEPYGTNERTDILLAKPGTTRRERFAYYSTANWNNGRVAVEVAPAGAELKMERFVRTPNFWPDGHGGTLPVGARLTRHEWGGAHGQAYARRLEELAAAVDSGEKKRRPLAQGQEGLTEKVTYRNGYTAVRKRVKGLPESGTNVEIADRETLAALVYTAVGVDVPVVLRTGEDEIVQEFIDRSIPFAEWKAGKTVEEVKDLVNSDEGRLLGLADMLVYNPDRHADNLRIATHGSLTHLVGIDHGRAFWDRGAAKPANQDGRKPPNISPTTMFTIPFGIGGVLWVENDMHPDDMALIRSRLEELKSTFHGVGRGEWYELMMKRFAVLEQLAVGTKRRVL